MSGLRGSPPRCPMINAASTDPTPPAPKTKPRSIADPCRAFFTMNGTSVSHGPHVHNRLTNAPISAAHNQGRSLTYRMPSFVSAQNEESSAGSRSVGRAWISMIITAENANVSASAMNAHPAPTLPTSRPPINGPDERHGERPDELPERVRFDEQLGRDDARHDRRERRSEQRLTHAVDDDQPDEQRDREFAGDGEHADRTDRQESQDVAGDHQVTAVDAVRQHAGTQQQDDLRERPRDPDGRERGGRVRQLVDLPRDGDDVDAVADHRDGHPDPQPREIADRERLEDADPAESRADAAHRPSIRSRHDDPVPTTW